MDFVDNYFDVSEHVNVVKDIVTTGEYVMIRYTLFVDRYKDDTHFDTLTEKAERERVSIIVRNEVITKTEYEARVKQCAAELELLNNQQTDKYNELYHLKKYGHIFKKNEEIE